MHGYEYIVRKNIQNIRSRIFVIIIPRIFMQIHIFICIIKKLELK